MSYDTIDFVYFQLARDFGNGVAVGYEFPDFVRIAGRTRSSTAQF